MGERGGSDVRDQRGLRPPSVFVKRCDSRGGGRSGSTPEPRQREGSSTGREIGQESRRAARKRGRAAPPFVFFAPARPSIALARLGSGDLADLGATSLLVATAHLARLGSRVYSLPGHSPPRTRSSGRRPGERAKRACVGAGRKVWTGRREKIAHPPIAIN